jgi:hypothetical protein
VPAVGRATASLNPHAMDFVPAGLVPALNPLAMDFVPVGAPALNPLAREFLPWWHVGGGLSADAPEFFVTSPDLYYPAAGAYYLSNAIPPMTSTSVRDRNYELACSTVMDACIHGIRTDSTCPLQLAPPCLRLSILALISITSLFCWGLTFSFYRSSVGSWILVRIWIYFPFCSDFFCRDNPNACIYSFIHRIRIYTCMRRAADPSWFTYLPLLIACP